MSHTMPMLMLTDEQREGHIERCEKHIKWMKEFAFNRYNDHDAIQQEIDIYQIALSALTAEPVFQLELGRAWEDTSKSHCEGMAKHGFKIREVYTAPPVPALKLTGKGCLAETSDKSLLDWQDGWDACLATIKRLNGVTE